MKTASGIHHITAIASDAKRNFDFYTKVLGLRFVKKPSILMIRQPITFILVIVPDRPVPS